jgi:hypothetical protein
LNLKAKFESAYSYFRFKRWNEAWSTWGQPGVNLHSPAMVASSGNVCCPEATATPYYSSHLNFQPSVPESTSGILNEQAEHLGYIKLS